GRAVRRQDDRPGDFARRTLFRAGDALSPAGLPLRVYLQLDAILARSTLPRASLGDGGGFPPLFEQQKRQARNALPGLSGASRRFRAISDARACEPGIP